MSQFSCQGLAASPCAKQPPKCSSRPVSIIVLPNLGLACSHLVRKPTAQLLSSAQRPMCVHQTPNIGPTTLAPPHAQQRNRPRLGLGYSAPFPSHCVTIVLPTHNLMPRASTPFTHTPSASPNTHHPPNIVCSPRRHPPCISRQ